MDLVAANAPLFAGIVAAVGVWVAVAWIVWGTRPPTRPHRADNTRALKINLLATWKRPRRKYND